FFRSYIGVDANLRKFREDRRIVCPFDYGYAANRAAAPHFHDQTGHVIIADFKESWLAVKIAALINAPERDVFARHDARNIKFAPSVSLNAERDDVADAFAVVRQRANKHSDAGHRLPRLGVFHAPKDVVGLLRLGHLDVNTCGLEAFADLDYPGLRLFGRIGIVRELIVGAVFRPHNLAFSIREAYADQIASCRQTIDAVNTAIIGRRREGIETGNY